MNDRPGAYYDDLALAPDDAFTIALLERLTSQLDGEWNATPDHESEEVHDMTITENRPDADESRGRGTRARWLIAAAAVLTSTTSRLNQCRSTRPI